MDLYLFYYFFPLVCFSRAHFHHEYGCEFDVSEICFPVESQTHTRTHKLYAHWKREKIDIHVVKVEAEIGWRLELSM